MSKVQKYSVPIKLEAGVSKKKTYFLNLNQYKRWHFQESNQLKRLFKVAVAKDIKQLAPIEGKCKVTYTIFYPNKRKFDIDNIGTVVSKFNNDALTELNILEDDNYSVIVEIVFKFGGIDKDNPRCDVELEELKDD
jgi:Holliday junction resolvase RusA-like endonuclease